MVHYFHSVVFALFFCELMKFLFRKLSSTQLPLVMNCRVTQRGWKPSYAMRISLLSKLVTKKTFLSSNFRAAAPVTWQLGGHFKDKQDVNWITQIQLNSKITKAVIYRKRSAPCVTTWIPKKSEIYSCFGVLPRATVSKNCCNSDFMMSFAGCPAKKVSSFMSR